MTLWLMLACGTEPTEDTSTLDTATPGCQPLYVDFDSDGWGSETGALRSCDPVAGYTATPGDCDDLDADVFPGATETCDERDQDCDDRVDEGLEQTWFTDADNDGYGDSANALQACAQPEGTAAEGGDCDDDEPGAWPGATEACNDTDDDCDRAVDEAGATLYADDDLDGYGDPAEALESCVDVAGYVTDDTDCDDTSAVVHPDATDSCDGVDTDCDGTIDEAYREGWTLVTIEKGGVVWQVDTSTAALTQIADFPGHEIRPTTTDVSDAGLSILQDSEKLSLDVFDVCGDWSAPIGQHGQDEINGIAFGAGGVLYGLTADTDSLYVLDPMTAETTLVGKLGLDLHRTGMAWDCANDILYGVDAESEILFELDTTTGQAINLRALPLQFDYVGLEFNAQDQTLWASTGPQLFKIDPVGGAITYVGDFGKSAVNDLALHPDCP